jgi:predicted HTH transcriptional regulator
VARTTDELLALLADLESDQVERKESLSPGDIKERICQAICAFANDLPDHRTSGVIFIGATDAGRPTGATVNDRLLLTLADLRDQGRILPPPIMSVRKVAVDGHDVAVVEVEPSPSPPVRVEIYSPGGPYGVVTVENFGQPGVTDYRNPILAEAMGGLGYVQKFGAGLPIARRTLETNGNPPAAFTPDPSYVGVIVREAK